MFIVFITAVGGCVIVVLLSVRNKAVLSQHLAGGTIAGGWRVTFKLMGGSMFEGLNIFILHR